MKISDLKNVNLVSEDDSASLVEKPDLNAVLDLIRQQGDFSAISPEAAEQLRKLKLDAGNGQLPEGAFVRFSIDVLSHQGTWNFFKNGMDLGNDITTIPDEWLEHGTITLEKLISTTRDGSN